MIEKAAMNEDFEMHRWAFEKNDWTDDVIITHYEAEEGKDFYLFENRWTTDFEAVKWARSHGWIRKEEIPRKQVEAFWDPRIRRMFKKKWKRRESEEWRRPYYF